MKKNGGRVCVRGLCGCINGAVIWWTGGKNLERKKVKMSGNGEKWLCGCINGAVILWVD